MLTFVIGRALRSLVVIVAAAVLLHALLMVYIPHQIAASRTSGAVLRAIRPMEAWAQTPWPASFFLWLFHAADPKEGEDYSGQRAPRIEFQLGNRHIRGSGALTGDFGVSTAVTEGVAVSTVVGSRLGNTLALVLAAFIPTVLVAVPLGVFMAARKSSPIDHTVTMGSFVGFALPPYWLGLMFVLFFAVVAKNLHDTNHWLWLPYLPPGGTATPGSEDDWRNRLYHVILPASTLALSETAILFRHVRSAMLEVLTQDYVRTAWAKGLPRRRVLFRHAFRNALIPIVTTVTLAFPALLAGTVVVENVFAFPGMGQLFFQAMGGNIRVVSVQSLRSIDYNIVMVLMLMMVGVVAMCSLIADLLYVTLNPRIGRG